MEKITDWKILNHLSTHKWKYISLPFILLFWFLYINAEQNYTPPTSGQCTGDVKKAIAEDYYKSPSTVVFQSCLWDLDEARGVTKILWEVDSQNNFGAIVRSEVYCEVWDTTQCKITQK